MNKFIRDIDEFHRKFELSHIGPPRPLPLDLAYFRYGFLKEESQEYWNASMNMDMEEALDALVDLQYVLLGTALMHGFFKSKNGELTIFEQAWNRVHEANMKKIRAKKDGSDSKRGSSYDVVKPEDWEPPTLSDLFDGHF